MASKGRFVDHKYSAFAIGHVTKPTAYRTRERVYALNTDMGTRTVCRNVEVAPSPGPPRTLARSLAAVGGHGMRPWPNQPRRFSVAFFPNAAFAGDTFACCGCPA